MAEFTWFRKDSETLCLSGFPIQIKLLPATSPLRFQVSVDGQLRSTFATLYMAKKDSESMATDLAEFGE